MITIYKLISPTNKFYIGSTKNKVNLRFKQHVTNWKAKNPPYKNCNTNLYYAFDKYHPNKWKVEILEETDTREREKFYIKKFDTIKNGYNICIGGEGCVTETISDSHKQNISKSRKKYFTSEKGLEWKKQLSQRMSKNNPSQKGRIPWNKGLTGIFSHTEETKRKISEKNKIIMPSIIKENWKKGYYANRPLPTKEQIEKAALARKGFKQSDKQKRIATELKQKEWIVTFPDNHKEKIINLKKFADKHGLDQGNMVKVSKGQLKQHKGYRCEKLNNK